jgi:hypothetical protein
MAAADSGGAQERRFLIRFSDSPDHSTPSLRAKRSDPFCGTKKEWIVASLKSPVAGCAVDGYP